MGKGMSEHVGSGRQGLVKKKRLIEAELAEVEELAGICDAYEDLRLRLMVEPMRTRTGDETNEFLYYMDDRLVGCVDVIGLWQ